MSTLKSDDFERADNADLGANWTVLNNAFKITSGVALPTATNADMAEAESTTLPASHWAECILNAAGTNGAGSGCGPLVRAATGGSFSYYRSVTNGAGWEITEWGSGGFVGSLASGTGTTFTGGDTSYLEWQGSNWNAKKGSANGLGGTSFSTGSDSTLNANVLAGISYSSDDGASSGVRSYLSGDFAGGDTLMAQISM